MTVDTTAFLSNYNIDTQYLEDLIIAIKSVNENYCKWDYNKSIQKTERVFAYELYHQFRLLISNNTDKYLNLRFDGEVGKKYFPNIPNIETGYVVDQKDFNPDLVLHKGQLDKYSDNQKLVIEIKTKGVNKEETIKDIIKLHFPIIQLNYQFAVFISVNTRLTDLLEKLTTSIPFPNYFEENFKKVIIINYRNQVLEIGNLYNILLTSIV